MPFSLPISQHDQYKKDVLSLDYEDFVHLVAIALHNYEVSVYDLYLTVNALYQRRSPAKTELAVGRLVGAELVFTTWRTVAVSEKYRIPVICASDQLQPGHREQLINQVQEMKAFPSGDSVYTRFGRRYGDIGLRAIYKILQNNPRQFNTLYQALREPTPYLQYERTEALKRVDAVLSVLDLGFWASRDSYFRELAWLAYQTNFSDWTELTPQRLEVLLQDLYKGGEPLPEPSRAVLLLGFHHFADRTELYEGDPALVTVADLTRGREPRLSPAAAVMYLEGMRGRPAGFVEIVLTAYAYGAGELTAVQLTEVASHFTLSNYPRSINCFIALTMVENGNEDKGEALFAEQLKGAELHPLDYLVALWCAGWMGYKLRRSQVADLASALVSNRYEQLPWLETELLLALQTQIPHVFQEVQMQMGDRARSQVQGKSALQALVPSKPLWAYALRQLRKTTSGGGQEQSKEPEYRTIWIVDFDTEEVYAKEQKMGKRGWSKGRKMKWTEFIRPNPTSVLEKADHRALAAITLHDGRPINATMHYPEDMLYASFGRMLYEIADHPRIYLDDKRRIPINLERAEPELQVTETPEGILLKFDPPVEAQGYVWRKETPTRYKVYQLSEAQAQMAFSIGEGIEIPASERTAVETIVEEIRPKVHVQSTFDLIDEDLEVLHGSPKPCFHLLPFGEGYKIELYAKPLPGEAFYFKPGEGLPRSIIILDEGRRLLERKLSEEVTEAAEAILECPTLARTPQDNYEWAVDDTQTALRILLELRKLVLEDAATIEHPKGEKLKISAVAGQGELSLRVGKSRDWFEVEGALTVDEKKVADLALLFEHLKQQRDNPFIQLGEGEFLAITDELRDKVLEMEGLLHARGNKLALPTLAAGAFADIAEDLEEVEFDQNWQESLDRIKQAENIRPKVPKSFNADLRDYQKTGFIWMMRLAAWGVGGCLADDMGLGKTVQSLAMLTARCEKGPALVIAPASVTRNWLRETEKFAPGLIAVLIASRQDTVHLSELGTGDLALVSYGLLPFIGDELQEIEWATIVIDEAQAIKNAATKRAKIVQSLNANFKLATTGTPIENHLGELWSLFRFLNPGLLGSKQAFNDKYNKPIAQGGDEERREALKNLVKPFILRRKKDEVLTELPPKTEIILNVELSEEEQNLYEAMRRHALAEIAAANEQQKRFAVLAQLTKLRQAACHPRLVRPSSKIGSAKLELVGETVLEILENGHKALIFSQFVKHLKIVENWVKGQGLPYQYLDGSTPGKKREEAVNAFQNGDGKVFLISLKAGGTGLNLTEADYVLHLDPWWNPAAEDQASDRAHRIGQQRPVTVYRFVSQGTIEEQIIALHSEKRDLADQILSGTGKAGALGVDEILSLITQA